MLRFQAVATSPVVQLSTIHYLRGDMLTPEHLIVTLARTVELFRTMPEAVPEQKAALRALVALTKLDDVNVHFDGSDLRVNDAPIPASLPSVPALLMQYRVHGVTDIEIEQNPTPADLLLLLRFLAAPAGDANPFAEGGTVRVTCTAVPARQEATSAADRDSAHTPDESESGEPSSGILTEKDLLSPLQDSGYDTQSLESALGALEHSPYEGDVLSRVSEVAALISEELHHDKLERALPAMAAMVDLESRAPDESIRRAYGIALRRLLEGDRLRAIAQMLLDARFAEGAAIVMMRAESAAVDIMRERLNEAANEHEAQAYLNVLKFILSDVRPLLPMLQHRSGHVSEGVATLMGELGKEEAVPALADAMEHSDSRTRRAAVAALAKIGTRAAVEHVLRAIASEDSSLRAAVVNGVQGMKSRALAMPILKVADQENVRPEVQRDCYLALGRIGTPDAVQALMNAAEPGGRLVGRKSTAQRVAAIEGLRYADDPKVADKLKQLVDDRDKAVRSAATKALSAVSARLEGSESS